MIKLQNKVDDEKANAILAKYMCGVLSQAFEICVYDMFTDCEMMNSFFPDHYPQELQLYQILSLGSKLLSRNVHELNLVQRYVLAGLVQAYRSMVVEGIEPLPRVEDMDREYLVTYFHTEGWPDDHVDSIEQLLNWEDYVFEDVDYWMLDDYSLQELYYSDLNLMMGIMDRDDYESCLNLVKGENKE